MVLIHFLVFSAYKLNFQPTISTEKYVAEKLRYFYDTFYYFSSFTTFLLHSEGLFFFPDIYIVRNKTDTAQLHETTSERVVYSSLKLIFTVETTSVSN